MCCLANRGPLNILPYVPSSLHFFPSLTLSRIAQISVSPGSNSSGSAVGALKEVQRKASPRKNIHHRRRMEVESDGSTEETDSSENWSREHIKDVPPLLSLEKKNHVVMIQFGYKGLSVWIILHLHLLLSFSTVFQKNIEGSSDVNAK